MAGAAARTALVTTAAERVAERDNADAPARAVRLAVAATPVASASGDEVVVGTVDMEDVTAPVVMPDWPQAARVTVAMTDAPRRSQLRREYGCGGIASPRRE